MPNKPTAQKRIARGKWVRLPQGAGSIRIERNGAVVYRAAAKRNPSKRKVKKQLARGMRATRAWVRAGGQFPTAAPKKKNGRKPAGRKPTARKKPANKRSK